MSVSVVVASTEFFLPRVEASSPCLSCVQVNAARNKEVSTYIANTPSAAAQVFATNVTSPHMFFPSLGVFLTDVAVSSCLGKWS